MNDYKLKIDIEPIDKYEKARDDLVTALKSISELSSAEKQKLADELIGVEKVAMIAGLFGLKP